MVRSPALATRAVHAGRDDLTDLGVHAVPLDLASATGCWWMSVGLEDVEDLWIDLDQALTAHPEEGYP